MPGRNLFNTPTPSSRAVAPLCPCVFISHRKADTDEARELAECLIEADVDIYFDEHDECLAGADENTAAPQVVRCIDAGLARCTHLLGLITPRTCGSWWVPYEIGATRARRGTCAFVVHSEVMNLPAYVLVALMLPDRRALANWLPTLRQGPAATPPRNFQTSIESAPPLRRAPSFLPETRDLRTMTFA